MESSKIKMRNLRANYCQATRCWKSNNVKSCLLICDKVTKQLDTLQDCDKSSLSSLEFAQLKHLVWFLRLRCLADDYYINESLLLNEDDIADDDQVRVFSGTRQRTNYQSSTRADSLAESRNGTHIGKRMGTGSARLETRQRTGILTGRMPSVSSRHSSRATSSYRPLTTSLTATQTAFSRSTRPLLKYSTCNYLSKLVFDYLYNAQVVTNKCPDYRQCLEYLNLVQKTVKTNSTKRLKPQNQGFEAGALISTADTSVDERKSLESFWLVAFGKCYFNLRMNKLAEEYFKLALILNQKHLDSYAWLIKIYLRSNQLNEVLKTCEDCLKHCKNSIIYNWMARVQSLIRDSYAANSHLRESLKYNPTNIEALANVGHFTFYGDKLEQSLKCFERIHQLSVNQSTNFDNSTNVVIGGSSAELLNNLALSNFYCGYHHKVMPLFLKAFFNSSGKEVTSDIWYNISFVPMSCGFNNLAIACLKLALKNNSQNEEAINNLGVLKYGPLIDDSLHFDNRHEIGSLMQYKSSTSTEIEVRNCDDREQVQALYDEAESYFGPTNSNDQTELRYSQPEMLYNMALIKRNRGHLMASVKYCSLYLEQDPSNYHMKNLLKDIENMISHDS